MHPRVRFAPSPTGNVHIGNIRTAIFNWLFARHEGGAFLLRIEDTDRLRSTQEAIDNLLHVMDWLGLDHDEEPLYQSARRATHLAAAEALVKKGAAYSHGKGQEGEAILLRIPLDLDGLSFVEAAGEESAELYGDEAVTIDASGLNYHLVSKKGKGVPQAGCLAGFQHLRLFDAAGACIFNLDEHRETILGGESVTVAAAARMSWHRHLVVFNDLIKGRLAKPIDSLKDFVIVRSDGSPVFHLANVLDDIEQTITHIIRGDDHVENTYRHMFIYHALGVEPPSYGHLPMIVNEQGKPYSKRDGDAYVGDFRAKGYLPEALFNFLTLLGWSPGDDTEKMTREELAQRFMLDRVKSSAAQFDHNKLDNLNAQYIAELPLDRFIELAEGHLPATMPKESIDRAYFRQVAELMQTRTKNLTAIADWAYFFQDVPAYDEKQVRKNLQAPGVGEALSMVRERLLATDFSLPAIEAAIHATTEACGIREGKLNQPLRIALTGTNIGAGVYETVHVLGRERVAQRLDFAVRTFCAD